MFMGDIFDPDPVVHDRFAEVSFEDLPPPRDISPQSSDTEWFYDRFLDHIALPWRHRQQATRNPHGSSTSSDSEHVDVEPSRGHRPSPRVHSRRQTSQGVPARVPSRRESERRALARVPSRLGPSQGVLARNRSVREYAEAIIARRVPSRLEPSQRVPSRVHSRREHSQRVVARAFRRDPGLERELYRRELGLARDPSVREPLRGAVDRIPSGREPLRGAVDRIPSRRELSPSRVPPRIVQVDRENPERPFGIPEDGQRNNWLIDLQVTSNPESQNSPTLDKDQLPVDNANKQKRKRSTSSGSTSSSSSDDNNPKQSKKPTNDFFSMFKNPDSFPDAILKCGDTEIPVHKCILSVRSPVFQALFKSNMIEKRDSTVDIVDIEPDVMEAMLKYVYGGKTGHVTTELAEGLLFASDKYQIDRLKRTCIKKLKTGMTPKNVVRILVLGELLDQSLKELAIEFIGNHFQAVEKTEEWKQLKTEREKLTMEVMLAVIKSMPSRLQRVKIDVVFHD